MNKCIFKIYMYLQGHAQCNSDPVADFLVLNHSNMIRTIFLGLK